MSRVINIKGKVIIKNTTLAEEAIVELGHQVSIENNQFVFNQYDLYDEVNETKKNMEIAAVESIYTQKFNRYLEQLAIEERKRIEEEKRLLREEKADIAIANAKKQGYKLKKEIREDNTIKLVLQKRVY